MSEARAARARGTFQRRVAGLREAPDALLRHLARLVSRDDLHPETAREIFTRFWSATRSRLLGRKGLSASQSSALRLRLQLLGDLLDQPRVLAGTESACRQPAPHTLRPAAGKSAGE